MWILPDFRQSSHRCSSGSNLCYDIFIVPEVVGDQGPKIFKQSRECNITIIDSNIFWLIQFVGMRIARTSKLQKNEHKFNFVKSHCKVLKTRVKGLGKISNMDCIIKICTNLCCVITAFFDVWMENPVFLLYSICIKMVEVIKHPKFIK